MEIDSEEFKEFCEIMDGMEEVNREMADKIDEALGKEQPTCCGELMTFDYGVWICEKCDNEVLSEVCPCDDDFVEY